MAAVSVKRSITTARIIPSLINLFWNPKCFAVGVMSPGVLPTKPHFDLDWEKTQRVLCGTFTNDVWFLRQISHSLHSSKEIDTRWKSIFFLEKINFENFSVDLKSKIPHMPRKLQHAVLQQPEKTAEFPDATAGFPAKWCLRKERRDSILMTFHFPDLVSASD